MGKGKRIIQTDEEIKIFADPYRMRIMEVFIEHKEPMTVKEVADHMGEVPAKIHYHVKKLISIDILELDHVEVIHGINAKYYKMVHESFSFKVNKEDSLGMKTLQLQGISKVVLNKIETFKKDFFERREQIQSGEEDIDNDGFVTSGRIYLNETEYEEFEQMVLGFIKKHNTQDNTKQKYSSFIGLIGKK